MSGNVYAVLGETELEIIAWLNGLDMRFAANYAEQALIGRKGLLQHTGFAPDQVQMRVLLHAQWCQPAAELARLKRIMDDTEPVAFVLGSGEYRGVFVVTGLDVVSTQTDGAGVAIAFEVEAQLREYIGDPASPNPPGVIAKGYRVPVGARVDDLPVRQAGPLAALSGAVARAVAATGHVAGAVSQVRSLIHVAASSPAAALGLAASRADGLLRAGHLLPVETFGALSGAAAVASDAAEVAAAFTRARAALAESAGWLQADPLASLSAAAGRAEQAVWFCEQAAGAVTRLAARAVVRGADLDGVAV